MTPRNLDASIEISDNSGPSFTAVWNSFLDREDLTDKEKLVWVALKSYAGYQEIRPSIKSIAKRASISVSTTRRTLAILANEKKIISIEKRRGHDGGSLPNRYTLLPVGREEGGYHPDTPPCQGDTRGGVSVTSKKDIFINKQKTTRQTIRQKPPVDPIFADPETRGRDFVFGHLQNTLFASADPVRIAKVARRYRLSRKIVEYMIDMLDMQYYYADRKIDDPTALLVSCLREDRAEPPANYVPRAQRIAAEEQRLEEARKKRAEKKLQEASADEAYDDLKKQIDEMPEEDRDKLLAEARKRTSATLRNFKAAIFANAIELLKRRTIDENYCV